MEIFGLTDKGRVRAMNQDIFRILEMPNATILAVCDGMGGANAGEVASETAIGAFMDAVRAFLMEDVPEARLDALLREAVVRAGEAVYERALVDPSCHGMGTTLVAAAVHENRAVIANVGDSRAYHLTGGAAKRVTRDHSVVEEMVERGDLSEEEARVHPSRNLITRVLGSRRAERPDIFEVTLGQRDRLLLCSDGLSNMLTDDELYSHTEDLRAEASVRKLLDIAMERGAPDNVTAVLFVK